ncbi:MAG TPA: DNA repair protein RecN [Fimbriimonadaceae bacterium]|nr:DNA repair protein RecN [Fimbriimonadaceae bacterium]
MIVELTVENLAIIQRAQIALGPGFTVLTGETGAGKSLLVDAVELAFGARADAELVRAGAPRAAVSVVLDLSANAPLRAYCETQGIELEDGLLYLHREVFAEGRSQARVSGKMTPVSALRQLGRMLVDLHGQHDHQSLLDAERHLGFLDAWIGQDAISLLEAVALHYRDAESLRQRLASLQAGQREREQRLDLLRYQIDEIEAADPNPGELEVLESDISRLRHAERLQEASAQALNALRQGETNARDLLASAARALEDAERLDVSLGAVLEPLKTALASLEDGCYALAEYGERIEANPERLEQLADRLDLLKRLRRKYGDDETQVLAFLAAARAELEQLGDEQFDEETLREKLAEADERLSSAAERLSELRTRYASEFSARVERVLNELAMEKARFQVAVRPKAIDLQGADDVEFFFSANLGEPPRPLAKIASGGEISRVMLAIKSAMAGRAGVPTLVFDEVDAGLGGRAAAVVGRKLEELAQHYQVLVISHLPQIAARATAHFRIEKVERSGRALTELRLLSNAERVEEIARMLAGEEVGDSAREHARSMLGHDAVR